MVDHHLEITFLQVFKWNILDFRSRFARSNHLQQQFLWILLDFPLQISWITIWKSLFCKHLYEISWMSTTDSMDHHREITCYSDLCLFASCQMKNPGFPIQIRWIHSLAATALCLRLLVPRPVPSSCSYPDLVIPSPLIQTLPVLSLRSQDQLRDGLEHLLHVLVLLGRGLEQLEKI